MHGLAPKYIAELCVPGAVNYVLLADDFRIFLAATCQTMVDVRSVSPVATSGTYFLSKSGNQHQ